jgi:hypothetical protein
LIGQSPLGYIVTRIFCELTTPEEHKRYSWSDQPYEQNGKVYPSLYQLYMAEEDVTEWEFAQKHIGSWEVWEAITQANWFQKHITRWRKELELKLKARHLKEVKAIADKGGKDALTANKYLLDKGYTVEQTPKRGRPTKSEIASKAHELAEFEKETQDDLQRIIN